MMPNVEDHPLFDLHAAKHKKARKTVGFTSRRASQASQKSMGLKSEGNEGD